MRVTLVLILSVLCHPMMAMTQVTSSANLGCRAAKGGMACNGISIPEPKDETKLPKLFVTHFTIEPGAALNQPSSSSDCLIVGINGGDLLNEKPPLLHVALEKGSVTLMPKEQPFLLRNDGSYDVELQLIEIRR